MAQIARTFLRLGVVYTATGTGYGFVVGARRAVSEAPPQQPIFVRSVVNEAFQEGVDTGSGVFIGTMSSPIIVPFICFSITRIIISNISELPPPLNLLAGES